MKTPIMTEGLATRRAFLGGVAAIAACALAPRGVLGAASPAGGAAPAGKPNSVFNGVRIGCITYSYRGGDVGNTAEDTLKALIKDGLSEVELMGGPIQAYMGKGDKSEQLAKCQAMRKMYNDAGVNIHIVKYDNIGAENMTDEEIDNCFQAAKALGATGITRELSDPIAKRLGPFADKHKIWIGFHNHTQLKPTTYDGDVLSYGKYLGINFDAGHYFAGTGESPIPFIEKYHERIVSLHLKDRTKAGGNVAWGQGETPIKEMLQLMRKNKWTFPADIELEYPVPQGSTAVAEVTKCVQFCKNALA